MTKKPALYTNERATPIILPVTNDVIAPPNTKTNGIVIKIYHFNVLDFANTAKAQIPKDLRLRYEL